MSLRKPSLHAKLIFDQFLLYPDIFKYLPFGPFKDIDDFLTNFVENRIRKDSNLLLFAIFDKTKPSQSLTNSNTGPDFSVGTLAGLIGFLNTSAPDLATEIGFVMILPPFQRTHVTSNAIGLLLNFTLNVPSPSSTSLGLRRVVWTANNANKASVRAAERMGFRIESVLRWDRVIPIGKEGNGVTPRQGDPKGENPGRDTAVLSLCWDDWEAGVREKVAEIMNRIS